jgi:hypothetical protein
LLWFYCLRIILEGGLLKGKKVRKEGVSVWTFKREIDPIVVWSGIYA